MLTLHRSPRSLSASTLQGFAWLSTRAALTQELGNMKLMAAPAMASSRSTATFGVKIIDTRLQTSVKCTVVVCSEECWIQFHATTIEGAALQCYREKGFLYRPFPAANITYNADLSVCKSKNYIFRGPCPIFLQEFTDLVMLPKWY